MKALVRAEVFARDKKCQVCKTKGNRWNPLTIHHIKPKVDYPELANDPKNCTLLCRDCHHIMHGIIPKEWKRK